MKTRHLLTLSSLLCLLVVSPFTWAKKSYNADDYAGKHNAKNIRMALASKGFTWLSGSHADNEKLAIGKSAQFFGFVALRYETERQANRGNLGRAFYQLANESQRQRVIAATQASEEDLASWWATRKPLLLAFEHHLYTGEGFNNEKIMQLAAQLGELNASVALHEARACFDVEKGLSPTQKSTLQSYRADPTLTNQAQKIKSLVDEKGDALPDSLTRQTEAIFAKCFSLLTGTFTDRQVVPLGQPAQFFGFVSLRQKSGRGAKRGKIAKEFNGLLTHKQHRILSKATQKLLPIVKKFMSVRTELMKEMDVLASDKPELFDLQRYTMLAQQLGEIEVQSGIVEASAYRLIRASFSPEQQEAMMELRSRYDVDRNKVEQTTLQERGQQLYHLCAGCHDGSTAQAPSVKGIVGEKIANKSYDYSSALKALQGQVWDKAKLDSFLKSPKQMVPGTKMEFTGLLNAKDREALIAFLKTQP